MAQVECYLESTSGMLSTVDGTSSKTSASVSGRFGV